VSRVFSSRLCFVSLTVAAAQLRAAPASHLQQFARGCLAVVLSERENNAARDCRRLDARALGPISAAEGLEGIARGLHRPVEALLRGHQPPFERGKPGPGFASEGC
jgi:hypothetical protein